MHSIAIRFVFVFCLVGGTFAQQDIQFSQTLSNPYLFNPAAGGMMNVAEIHLGTRLQWLSVEGKPMTYYASGQSQIRFKKNKETQVLDPFNREGKSVYGTPQRTIGRKHIAGGRVSSDVIGPFSKTSAMASYAIHLPLTQKINIGAGIGLGWNNFSLNESKVTLSQANDNAYLNYISAGSRQNMVDAQAGLVAYNDHFFVGLSVTQLFKNTARFQGVETDSYFERHLYLAASYRFDLGKTYALEPVFLLKNTVASPVSLDAGFRFHYQRMGWLSFSYRNQSTLAAGIGLNVFKHLQVAYAYEMGINGLRSYGGGSHEIQLGILIGSKERKEKPPMKEEERLQEEDELKIGTE